MSIHVIKFRSLDNIDLKIFVNNVLTSGFHWIVNWQFSSISFHAFGCKWKGASDDPDSDLEGLWFDEFNLRRGVTRPRRIRQSTREFLLDLHLDTLSFSLSRLGECFQSGNCHQRQLYTQRSGVAIGGDTIYRGGRLPSYCLNPQGTGRWAAKFHGGRAPLSPGIPLEPPLTVIESSSYPCRTCGWADGNKIWSLNKSKTAEVKT